MGKQLLLTMTATVGLACASSGALVINVTQVGGQIQLLGTGSVDLTGLTSGGTRLANSYFFSGLGEMSFNTNSPDSPVGLRIYNGGTPGGSFGNAAPSAMTTISGDYLFLGSDGSIALDLGYLSGASLNLSATIDATYEDLLVSEGDYVWTLPNDTITVSIQPVPEPSTAILLLGFSVSLARLRRRS